MTALAASHNALREALGTVDLAGHIRDARSVEEPCEHWVGQRIAVCAPCLRDRIVPQIIDALLTSGAVDTAALVDRIRALTAFTVDDGANEVDVVYAEDLFAILDELGGAR